LYAGLAALGLTVGSAAVSLIWPPAAFAMPASVLLAGMLFFLALSPPIELRDGYLTFGQRAIAWRDIRVIERLHRRSPLLVRLTLAGRRRAYLLYAGDADSCGSLFRQICRFASLAEIEGRTYREYWGEALPPAEERRRPPSPRPRLLRPEDEAEVEMLYRRLKTVGRLDSTKGPQEDA